MQLKSQQGSSVIIAVVLISVMGFAFLMAYQGVLRVYQQRYAQLKEAEKLYSIAEGLAVAIRQGRDVALGATQFIGGVPQVPPNCPPDPDGDPVLATAVCFRTGVCTPLQAQYLCFPTDDSRCVTDDRGVSYCWGQDSNSGDPDEHSDIQPLQVIRYENPEMPRYGEVAELRQLFKPHWTDPVRPVSQLALNYLDRSKITRPKMGSEAMASTTNMFLQAARMNTENCVSTSDVCKQCDNDSNPCVEIALCPSFLPVATCQSEPQNRFFQVILMTE